MTTVSISPKFQIVIPKEVRKDFDLSAGMKIAVISYKNRIELIPLGSIRSLKGTLAGIDTNIVREKDRL